MANSDGLIRIDFDLSQIKDATTIAVQREIPFAVAQVLTQLGRAAQKGVRADLASHFTLRNKYISSSIRIDPERVPKGQWHVDVGATSKNGNDLMELEAIGGEGKAKKGGDLWIPTGDARARAKPIPPNQRPKSILKKGAFFATMPSGKHGIFEREGKARLGLHMIYAEKQTVKIKAIWPLEAVTGKSVADVYQALFVKALDRALKPRK